jgi:hypothetical protein
MILIPECFVRCAVSTMDSSVLGLGSSGCDCCTVRVFRQNPFTLSRMPLDPTHVRLKLLHACDQWHASRGSTPLTGWHCKLRPNTEGQSDQDVGTRFLPLVRNHAVRLLAGESIARCPSLSSGQHPIATDTCCPTIGRRANCMVRVFRQELTPEDAIELHAFAPLEALPCG